MTDTKTELTTLAGMVREEIQNLKTELTYLEALLHGAEFDLRENKVVNGYERVAEARQRIKILRNSLEKKSQ